MRGKKAGTLALWAEAKLDGPEQYMRFLDSGNWLAGVVALTPRAAEFHAARQH